MKMWIAVENIDSPGTVDYFGLDHEGELVSTADITDAALPDWSTATVMDAGVVSTETWAVVMTVWGMLGRAPAGVTPVDRP